VKPIVGVLLGSLVLNAAMIGVFVARPAAAPPSWHEFFARWTSARYEVQSALPAKIQRGAQVHSDPRALSWAALHTDDLPAFVGRLRAAGASAARTSPRLRRLSALWRQLARDLARSNGRESRR
jgi:hypothetical protein